MYVGKKVVIVAIVVVVGLVIALFLSFYSPKCKISFHFLSFPQEFQNNV